VPFFGHINGVDEIALWHELRTRVPHWFRACLNIDDEDFHIFQQWLQLSRVTWIRSADVVVFLVPQRSTHVVAAHLALLTHPVDSLRGNFCELLQWIFALGWKRIEVPVTEVAGHTIRRLLREMGFQREGTMRSATKGFDASLGRERYLDVDLWAILREGDINGPGC
jgi:hypothetical protein